MPPDRAIVCLRMKTPKSHRSTCADIHETAADLQEFAESNETDIHCKHVNNTRNKHHKNRGGSYRRWQCQASRHTRCIRTKQQQYLTWIYSAGPSQYTPGTNRHHQTKLTMGQDTSEAAHDNFIQGQDISSYEVEEPKRLSEPSV